MDGDSGAMDVLEAKLSRLERLVYGNGAVLPNSSNSAIESIISTNTLLNAAANGRQNIGTIYRRMDELNKDLTEGASGEAGSETERKLNVIMALQSQYHSNAAILEKVRSLEAALDEGHLKCLEELQAELATLVDQYSVLCSEMNASLPADRALTAWQSLVLEVTKGLASANNALNEVENRKLGLTK